MLSTTRVFLFFAVFAVAVVAGVMAGSVLGGWRGGKYVYDSVQAAFQKRYGGEEVEDGS